MHDIEEEDEEEELLFCFDLENMYTYVTYTLQDQGINHTIYVHVP